jgi:uncharacterized membrane protein
MLGQPIQLTGSGGYVVKAGHATRIKSITLLGGSDSAVATLKEAGGSGTERLELKAALNTTVHEFFGDNGFLCTGAHIAMTGTTPKVTVVIV